MCSGKYQCYCVQVNKYQCYCVQVNTNTTYYCVQVSVHQPDKRDPDYGFHDMTGGTMTAYSIKPASFDLLLSAVIAAYMGLLFLALQQLPLLQKVIVAASPPMTNGRTTKYKSH